LLFYFAYDPIVAFAIFGSALQENQMAEEPNKKPAAMQANATVRYVDRPECTEIFADSIIASVSTARRCAWSSASPPRRDQAECSHHGPALSGVPAGALRQRRRRADQSHAADRGLADPGRRRER